MAIDPAKLEEDVGERQNVVHLKHKVTIPLSFPIQKITLQIWLVSKQYILVVNFGKNVQKGEKERVISNPN